MSFSEHVNQLLMACSQRMFLLRQLRVRGLPVAQLNVIFSALILGKILYAVTAWGGFLSIADQKRIDSLLIRCRKFGYSSTLSTCSFCDLLLKADRRLFKKTCDTSHCLNMLLPDVRRSAELLRSRGHPYVLPYCRKELYKKSFIVRSLFNFI